MSNVIGPVGTQSSSIYWRRRGLLLAVGTVGALVLVRACGGGTPPEIEAAAAQMAVPLVSTYTPIPTSAADVPVIGPDGMLIDPAADPALASPTGAPSPSPTIPTSEELERMVAQARAAATAGENPGGEPAVAPVKKLSPKALAKLAAQKAAAASKKSCAAGSLEVNLRSDQRVYSAKQTPKLFIAVQNISDLPCRVDLGSKALSFTIKSGEDRIWSSDDCQGKGTSDVRVLKPGQSLEARAVWSKVRSSPGCPKGAAPAKPGTYVLEGNAGGVQPQRRAVFFVT